MNREKIIAEALPIFSTIINMASLPPLATANMVLSAIDARVLLDALPSLIE